MSDAAVSPLARAIRLGREIRRLRERAGLSQEALARQLRITRTALSRAESPDPERPADPHHMRSALRALADPEHLPALESLIWDATQHGWWETWRRMGAAQQLVAAVECGAARIREYHLTLIPGLAQTARYARYRAEVSAAEVPDIDSVVDGRVRRQEQIVKAGTEYHLLLEEIALRRPGAPPEAMAEQLRHLIALGEQPSVSVRVLPADAPLSAGWSPTSPYSIYDYPDPADPTIVLTDVTGRPPELVTSPAEVRLYVQLHDRLDAAALSDVDSAAVINDAATQTSGR